MCVPAELLKHWLPKIKNDNVQNEYYLTDIIAMAASDNVTINTMQPHELYEIEGVNDRKQLANLERKFQRNLANQLMADGATLADPTRIDIRGSLKIGRDTFIDVTQSLKATLFWKRVLLSMTKFIIEDAHISSGTEIYSNTVIESARMVSHAR